MNKLEELRKLAEAATPGPWKASDAQWGQQIGCFPLAQPYSIAPTDSVLNCAAAKDYGTAAFIAAANPQTILALLDLIELRHDAVNDSELSDTRDNANAAYIKFKEQS